MSLFADYKREREQVETLEHEHGFVMYKIFGEECYIIDIYVNPDFRMTGLASLLADKVTDIAKLSNCKTLTGTIDTRLVSSTISAKILFAYGFRILRNDGPVTWFVKEIS